MKALPTLHLDKSTAHGGLRFEHPDGTRATLDEAFAEGFVVEPDDAPAVLTFAKNMVEGRELHSI